MNQKEEIENFAKQFRSFVRRTKYSMAIFGMVIHAFLFGIFFKASDQAIAIAHNKAGLLALAVGLIACAALIETGMLLFDKRLEVAKEDKPKDEE